LLPYDSLLKEKQLTSKDVVLELPYIDGFVNSYWL